MFEAEKGEEVELAIVNEIRTRVKNWRQGIHSSGLAYDGASGVIKELLELWCGEDRMQRLFFTQIEAVETLLFLVEASEIYRKGLPEIPRDEPGHESKAAGFRVFVRYACKMATGSGKTTVMRMLAAWSILNRVAAPTDDRFSGYDPDRLPERDHPGAAARIRPGARRFEPAPHPLARPAAPDGGVAPGRGDDRQLACAGAR